MVSYTTFGYNNLKLDKEVDSSKDISLQVDVTNSGGLDGDEVVQLYIRDLVGNVTRPIRELKGFKRVHLEPGESKSVSFELDTDDLAFHNRKMERVTEPGDFHVWIGGNSDAQLWTEFAISD